MSENIIPVLIIGLGNVLLTDDGLGVHVINQLNKRDFSREIEILEGGTLSINLLDELIGREKVIAIDAVKGGQKPGTLYKFNYSEVKQFYNNNTMSLHQLDFVKALEIGEFLGKPLPEITIFGVEPESLGMSMELSESVQSRVPDVIDAIIREVEYQNVH